jgi:hypothetical protein
MGLTCCAETSVLNYPSTLQNITEEQKYNFIIVYKFAPYEYLLRNLKNKPSFMYHKTSVYDVTLDLSLAHS